MEIGTILCFVFMYWQFVVGLTVNKYYEEGSNVILICKFRSLNSSVILTWFGPTGYEKYSLGQNINPKINAQKEFRLNITGNHTIGEYNLQISNFQQQDEGKYKCQLSNIPTPKEEIDLKIKVVLTDVIIVPSGHVAVESSQRKQFHCSAKSLPLPAIVWNLDSNQIFQKSTSTTNLMVTSVYEYIGDEHDIGKIIYCTATSDGVTVRSVNAQLNVTYGPGTSQQLDPPDTSIEKNKGEDLYRIRCSADCNPSCQYQWTNDSGQVVILGDTLFIQSLKKTDHGTYRCRAWNGIGESSIDIMLTVNYGPEYINLLPNNSTYELQEFTSLPVITCHTECRPSCFTYWIGPKNKVKQSDTVNIRNITRTQAGTYSCFTNNSFGRLSSNNVDVIITYGASVVSLDTTAGTNIFNQSQNVNITCNVVGVPQPKIQWTFDGEEINDQENRTSYVFTTACENTGNYTCIVKNSLGDGKETKEIFVQCSPRISGDVSTCEQIFVKEGEGLNITVTLIAFPQPDIHWYFKNSSVLANNSFGSFEHKSYLYKATVKQTDFGIYSLIASNTMGNMMFDVLVGPERVPDPPVILSAQCNHLTMEVIWNASFNGGDKQSFIIKATKFATIEPMYTTKIEYFGKNPLNTTVKNLHPGTLFEVVVIALNNYGETKSEGIANCTTDSGFPQSKTTTEFASTLFALGFGAGVIVTVIIVVILFVVIYKRHRQNKIDKTRIYEEANSRSGTNIYHELNLISQESCLDLQEKRQNAYEDISTYDNQACESEDQPKQTQQEVADSNTNFGRVYTNMEI